MDYRFRAAIGRLLFQSQLHRAFLANVAVVVAFHRVNDVVSDGLTCSVKKFQLYCRFFADHFDVVPLGQVIEKLENEAPLNRELAITFDDGYRDNFEHAVPVLKNIGLPATFFVVTGFMDTDKVAWWDRDLASPPPWMAWDHVRQLSDEGFDIGAHTRTHADLGNISANEAEREIIGSRFDLEQRLGKSVPHFAYPYGKRHKITDANREIVMRAGFRCCCSCYGGLISRGVDPFHLRRVPISDWYVSPYHFGLEAAFRRV